MVFLSLNGLTLTGLDAAGPLDGVPAKQRHLILSGGKDAYIRERMSIAFFRMDAGQWA
ncbi:hypothetical protein ANRL2_00396 [Anaerolineae bacterium]|nr:hypothetical protein ANRL2_00396 [Anaerolineae bacterium]